MSLVPELIKVFLDERRTKRDRDDALFESLRHALQKTKEYIEEEKRGWRSRDKERQLSNLWSQAGTNVAKYDRDLGDRLFQKGDYWLDPETWGENDIDDAGIAIERIDMEIKDYLLAR